MTKDDIWVVGTMESGSFKVLSPSFSVANYVGWIEYLVRNNLSRNVFNTDLNLLKVRKIAFVQQIEEELWLKDVITDSLKQFEIQSSLDEQNRKTRHEQYLKLKQEFEP